MHSGKGKWLFLLFFLAIIPCIHAADFNSAIIQLTTTTARVSCTAGQGYSCYSMHYSADAGAWQHSYDSNAEVSFAGQGSIVLYYSTGEACTAGECTYVTDAIKSFTALPVGNTAPTISLNAPNGGETVTAS